MTFLQKALEIDKQKGEPKTRTDIVNNSCPSDYGLECPTKNDNCTTTKPLDCQKCWDREIPSTEPKPQFANPVIEKAYNTGFNDGLNADKWIPCSERLPKEATVYEVTEEVFINSKKQYVVEHRLFGTEGEWLCPCNRKVIAWQPLPEPYKVVDHEM